MDEVKLNNGDKILEMAEIALSGADGRIIFEQLNLSLPLGRAAIIKGPTGAGKTTLAEMIIGVKKPDSGTVTVFGKEIYDRNKRYLNKARQKIGGVGGIFQPIAYQTIYENLSFPLILRGEPSVRRNRRILDILKQLNLLNKKEEIAINLSRGEQILLLLGRAIIADQPLILIDEPLAGLDPDMAGVVARRLRRLAVAGHSLIVLTTGQTGVELPDADEYILVDGKLQ